LDVVVVTLNASANIHLPKPAEVEKKQQKIEIKKA
jgi:hypothetical protein